MNFFNHLKSSLIITISSFLINVILIILIIFLYVNQNNYEDKVDEYPIKETESIALQDNNEEYTVEVKGAIKNAGVYRLKSDSIINDLINLAGGFNKDAYTNNINLSRKISNEMVLYVFTKKEYNSNKNSNVKIVEKVVYEDKPCECKTADITNCINNNQSEIIASTSDSVYSDNVISSEVVNGKININTASVDELTTLPGIGLSKANDIINYRNANGLFSSIEDIKNVSGIGNAVYEKIKELITI